MIKQWFITGTDTNVGKTVISTLLLKLASKKNFKTAGYKPIASGCQKTSLGLQNQDALLLQKNSNVILEYKDINPFAFYESQPPSFLNYHNSTINFEKISIGLQKIQKKANWIIIEGIGGWHTPIYQSFLLSDWVKKEELSVILVVHIKLGCINHTFLTYNAIVQSNLNFFGWFANHITYEKNLLKYITTIENYINKPCLGIIPYIQDLNNVDLNNVNLILPD